MDWHCACTRRLARGAAWTGIAPAPATWQGTRHGLALRLLPPLGKGRGMDWHCACSRHLARDAACVKLPGRDVSSSVGNLSDSNDGWWVAPPNHPPFQI
ncbi:MAG: hypothetical protein IJJ33_15000 [Victivallales bacterium]|nr:hypothetical protein [Victivallales bacterium]